MGLPTSITNKYCLWISTFRNKQSKIDTNHFFFTFCYTFYYLPMKICCNLDTEIFGAIFLLATCCFVSRFSVCKTSLKLNSLAGQSCLGSQFLWIWTLGCDQLCGSSATLSQFLSKTTVNSSPDMFIPLTWTTCCHCFLAYGRHAHTAFQLWNTAERERDRQTDRQTESSTRWQLLIRFTTVKIRYVYNLIQLQPWHQFKKWFVRIFWWGHLLNSLIKI